MTIPSGYNLVWCDEFDGTSINWNKWQQRVNNSPNVKVANGKLQLWANPIGNFNTGSAFITVKDIPSFKYGYFETSAQNSTVQGVATAFWLLGLNSNTEIDIYERPGNFDNYQNRVICSLVAACSGTCSNFNGNDTFPQVASGFHKYALLWSPTQMRFYLDDVEIWNADNKASGYNIPLELKLDICTGSCKFQNVTIPTGSGSTYSEFEYVRVYQQGGTSIICGTTNGPCGQPTCYKCDGTSCIQDNINGTLTKCTPNPCVTNGPCGQPTCYKCSGASCVQDNTNGIYTSSNCDSKCGSGNGPCGQPTCYKCSGTSCVQDNTNGIYTSSNCDSKCGSGNGPCGQPTCYKCSGTSCVQDNTNGIYTTNACNNVCNSGGDGGDNDYWLQKTTCFAPSLCVPNKYIAIGTGSVVVIILLGLIFKRSSVITRY